MIAKARNILPLLSVVFCAACAGHACTLWSAAGKTVDGEGTLISKNRDWAPQMQSVKLVVPKDGYSYVALLGVDAKTKSPYVVAGTNQHGFTVVIASATAIPEDKRKAQPWKPRLLAMLLASCKTVEEALSHKDWLYGPRFLLMSDRSETACVEIGLDKKTSIERSANGVLCHTNYYVSKELSGANSKLVGSVRLQRIKKLLADAKKPLDVKQFETFSKDHVAGPLDSLFRTGKSLKTIATWIVRTPPAGSPIVYAKLWNPDEPEKSYVLNVEDLVTGKARIQPVPPPASKTQQ